jgi:hypothetical protein
VVLALVIFNVLFMGLMTYSAHEAGDRYERIIGNAFKYCPQTRDEKHDARALGDLASARAHNLH